MRLKEPANEKTTFTTTDIYLASALKLSGFKLVTLEKDAKGYGVFVFQDQPNRVDVVRQYFSGELKGSLKQFANFWGDLKSMVNQQL